MYLPRSLPLCSPHLALWTGNSGKRYDFAVLRTGTAWIDEPAVYILARQDDSGATPLLVGETESLQLDFRGHRERGSDYWRAAMANGMTHVHVRFEATSAAARRAEVADLLAALQPPCNAIADAEPAAASASGFAAGHGAETADAAGAVVAFVDEIATRTVRVPYRVGRLSPSRPSVEPGEPAPAQWLDEPTLPLWQLRADPAREVGFDEDADQAAPFGTVVFLSQPDARPSRPEAVFAEQPEAVFTEQLEAGFAEQPEAGFAEPPEAGFAEQPDAAFAEQPAVLAGRPEVAEPAAAERPAVTPLAATAPSAGGSRPTGHGSGRRLLTRLLRLVTGRRAARPALPDQPSFTDTPAAPAAGGIASDDPAAAPAAGTPSALGDGRDDIEGSDAAAADIRPPEAAPAAAIPEGNGTADESVVAATGGPAAEDVAAPATAAEISAAVAAEDAAAPSLAERTRARMPAAKRALALDPQSPVVLFAGDVGWHGGADILFEAMLIVCAGDLGVQFVYAGDGALRSELQERAGRAALGPRCRFLGDVSAQQFPDVLACADFIAIPARSAQDEGLARAALAQGKPLLVTHQAGLGCVVHGRNGLVTYDNPGSFVWGIRELLGPLYDQLLRDLDRAA